MPGLVPPLGEGEESRKRKEVEGLAQGKEETERGVTAKVEGSVEGSTLAEGEDAIEVERSGEGKGLRNGLVASECAAEGQGSPKQGDPAKPLWEDSAESNSSAPAGMPEWEGAAEGDWLICHSVDKSVLQVCAWCARGCTVRATDAYEDCML